LEFLLRESSDAQFFAIAAQLQTGSRIYDHAVQVVARSLWLQPFGSRRWFRYLSDVFGKGNSRKRDAVIGLARRYPNALQFTTDQELRMIAGAA
jgi:hypothetical protein